MLFRYIYLLVWEGPLYLLGGRVGQTLKEVPAQENLRKKYHTKRAMKTKSEGNLLPRKVAQPPLLQNFLMKKKYIYPITKTNLKKFSPCRMWRGGLRNYEDYDLRFTFYNTEDITYVC